MKFFGISLILLFGMNLFAGGTSSKYTDYDDGIRIQNQNVSNEFGNPLEIARKIKSEAKADWVYISGIRRSYDLLDREVARWNKQIPVVIKFTTKKDEEYAWAVCDATYFVADPTPNLLLVNDHCDWRVQLSSGKVADVGNFSNPFSDPDGAVYVPVK